MRRREFIQGIAGSATVWPLAALAQSATGRIRRIGIIDDSPSWDPFRQQLRELHYVEGQNLAYVNLRTDGSSGQLDAAAAVLAQLPVNVIAAFGTPRAKAAQRATKTIPIVAISISDPITAGLVTSLAHPGGNVTGNTILGPEVVTKKLQILKDAFPGATRVAYLWNPDNPATAEILEDLRKAAPLFHITLIGEARQAQAMLGIKTTVLEATTRREIDAAFAKSIELKVGALIIGADPYFDSSWTSLLRWQHASICRQSMHCAGSSLPAD